MRLTKVRAAGIVSILLLSSLLIQLHGQTYHFRNYSVDQGLPGRFVYTLNQDDHGFLWIGTGNGLTRYDGFNFVKDSKADSLTTGFAVTSCKASDGSLFFGFSDGKLLQLRNRKMVEIDGISANRINDIIPDPQNRVLVISQMQGIFRVDPVNTGKIKKIDAPVDYNLYSATFATDNTLLLGTQQGIVLTRFNNDILDFVYETKELAFIKVQDIEHLAENRYLVGTEDDGLYIATVFNDSISLGRLDNELLRTARIQSIITGENVAWIATFGSGTLKLDFNDDYSEIKSVETFNEQSGLGSNDVKALYSDNEGNIWMGLFGAGFSILGSDAYLFFTPGNGHNENNIITVMEYGGYIFAGSQQGYYLMEPASGGVVSYTRLSQYTKGIKINVYHLLSDGRILFGTDGEGVFLIEKNGNVSKYFRSRNNLENYINDIKTEGNNVWLATRSGVIVINTNTLESRRFTTYDMLPHNSINQVLPDSSGKIYVATQANRLYTINTDGSVHSGKAVIYSGARIEFQAYSIDTEGKIWVGTRGSGVFCFAGDTVWNLSSESGLLSDYCYSILADKSGKVWIGHERGFSVYDQEQAQIRTFVDIFSAGADCNRNAIYEMNNGVILLGTNEGLMVYDSRKDLVRLTPPVTNILSLTVDNTPMPFADSYVLPYKSRYTVKIDYVGLYYSDPDKVYFRSRLDNYDTDWSEPTYSHSQVYRLSDGKYRFRLLSYNYDGISNNEEVGFDLVIKKPLWRMWWFVLIILAVLAGLVALIISLREKAQRKARQELEDELALRTKEVIDQKEEIELQNREITDSINYAQRIQASLLPPYEKLNEIFNGAFVFYRPRDIVSGDFYWFDKPDEDRIIVVCADSTGHGVPGAFMSMIGSALIQEIILRKDITRPSEILLTLDKEISSTLNQGVGGASTNDGMDMIVCEFNLKTRLLRFASAMRPVILVMGGEQFYIRGNKSSIGGEELYDKFFDDQEYYLKENDLVYMFSDGYPDQFGGEAGKKLKIARLKQLIDDIKELPMDIQYNKVKEHFDSWKGDLDQVDDVLFMAVRV